MDDIFTAEQLAALRKPLDQRLISERKGGHGKVKYLQGRVVIDQADSIFGYGCWGYRPLSVEQVVIHDPLSGEAVGVAYEAVVELVVHGCEPIVDVGSQPVAVWNVEDLVLARRISEAEARHTKIDMETKPSWAEKKAARTAIMDAHENARKGAVTDGLKRALRVFGEQFGNSLYGDGMKTLPIQSMETKEQRKRIDAYCKSLGRQTPDELTQADADQLLRELFAEYNTSKQGKTA